VLNTGIVDVVRSFLFLEIIAYRPFTVKAEKNCRPSSKLLKADVMV
jgi:hypothetical protein